MRHLLIFSVLIFASCIASGQLSKEIAPKSEQLGLTFGNAPLITMPGFDLETALQEDQQNTEDGSAMRVAWPYQTDLNFMTSSSVTSVDGGTVRVLRVKCEGALFTQIAFGQFYLPKGATLHVYAADKKHVLGAFTSENNNNILDRFSTSVLGGPEAVIEYFEPAGAAPAKLKISRVSHGYRKMGGYPEFYNISTPYSITVGVDCNTNVGINCSPEGDDWQVEKNSAAFVIIDGAYICSGNLVANTTRDCTPLFSFASHCLNGHDAVADPDGGDFTFIYQYEVAGCGPDPTSVTHPSTYGATILANDATSDFALLRLLESPVSDPSIPLYYLGWDFRPGSTPQNCISVSHPSGAPKKIATASAGPAGIANVTTVSGVDDLMWSVTWQNTANGHGSLQGGSSGSALLDENGRWFGNACCATDVSCAGAPTQNALYTRNVDLYNPAGVSDQRKLKPWLDARNSGAQMIDGYDPRGYLETYVWNVDDSGQGSLRSACTSCPGGKDIRFDPVTDSTPIRLHSEIEIVGDAYIIGNVGAGNFYPTIIDGDISPEGVLSKTGGNLTLLNLKFQNSKFTAVYTQSAQLGVYECNFVNNIAGIGGSAISFQATSKPAILVGCNFRNCFTWGDGAAIKATSDGVNSIFITSCGFYDNAAVGSGGAVNVRSNTPGLDLFFDHCTFDSNGSGLGSAIFSFNSDLTVTASTIVNNIGTSGAVYSLGDAVIDHNIFDNPDEDEDYGGFDPTSSYNLLSDNSLSVLFGGDIGNVSNTSSGFAGVSPQFINKRWVHPIVDCGNPAIDLVPAGMAAVVDVLGQSRNVGMGSDAGAYEYQIDCTVCNTSEAPDNLSSTVTAAGVTLNWDAVFLSEACEVRGGPLGGPVGKLLVSGPEPTSAFIPASKLTSGITYEWRVQCACNLSPFELTPQSAPDQFTFVTPAALRLDGSVISFDLFPNPATETFTLNLENKDADTKALLSVIDLLGRTHIVEQIVLAEGLNRQTINISGLRAGNYLVALAIDNEKTQTTSLTVVD